MIDQERLDEIQRRIDYFEDQRARAEARLAQVSGSAWYFGLVGFRCELDPISFEPLGLIQRVVEPPGEVALASALKDGQSMSAVGRYSRSVTHELLIRREHWRDDDTCMTIAYHLLGALRLKSLAEFLVPVVSDQSWSTIAAIVDNSCTVRLLEDYPQARRVASVGSISAEDCTWTNDNYAHYLGLMSNPKFTLAAEALTQQHLTQSKRLMAASLWSGIEALFDIQSELRFRISATIASVLEPRGAARRELYKRVQKLYDVRSKAVHGSAISDIELTEHIQATRALLARLLCMFVEKDGLPNTVDFEEMLFC